MNFVPHLTSQQIESTASNEFSPHLLKPPKTHVLPQPENLAQCRCSFVPLCAKIQALRPGLNRPCLTVPGPRQATKSAGRAIRLGRGMSCSIAANAGRSHASTGREHD